MIIFNVSPLMVYKNVRCPLKSGHLTFFFQKEKEANFPPLNTSRKLTTFNFYCEKLFSQKYY